MSSFDSLLPRPWRLALKQQKKSSRRKVLGSVIGRVTGEKVSSRVTRSRKLESRIAGEENQTVIDEKFEVETTTTEVQLYSALKIVQRGTYELLTTCEEPEFEHDEEVMIRNCATGLNPIDWKSVDYNFCLPSFPWVTGREMAGVVQKVAPGVTNLKVGDRVWTSTYYRDARAGCFQDLVTVPQHTVLPMPSSLEFEAAACLGVAGLTAAMTLWKWLQVPRSLQHTKASNEEKDYLLVWGGSTVTGQFAIQIGILSGLEVIAVTSEKTQALAESLGAHVVTRDGKSNEDVVECIRKIGGERITRGVDLVGNATAPFSIQSLSKTRRSIFAPLAMMKEQKVPENIDIVNVEMKQFVLDKTSRGYAEDLNRLVEDGSLKLPELHVMPGGLAAIEGGLMRLKGGDMGGKKMVVSWA